MISFYLCFKVQQIVYNLQYMVEPRSEMALPMTMLQKKNNPMLCFVGEGGLQSAPDFAAERCIDSTTKIMMMIIVKMKKTT